MFTVWWDKYINSKERKEKKNGHCSSWSITFDWIFCSMDVDDKGIDSCSCVTIGDVWQGKNVKFSWSSFKLFIIGWCSTDEDRDSALEDVGSGIGVKNVDVRCWDCTVESKK